MDQAYSFTPLIGHTNPAILLITATSGKFETLITSRIASGFCIYKYLKKLTA